MKEIQNQIKRSFAVFATLFAIAIAFMATPYFEGQRAAAASSLGLTPDALWIPLAAILIAALYLTYLWLNATIAKPIQSLARHVREGESSDYNLGLRSKSKEEHALKGYIQDHDQVVAEVREERDAFEKELKATRNERDAAQSLSDRQASEIAELDRILKKTRVEAQTSAAANEVLETALETERKTKVGREVKRRAEEIYSQVERAVSEASARSIWIPNLLSKIETPTTLINTLSKNLEANWSQLSITRIEEEIAEIRKQSDLQLVMLETVEAEDILPAQIPTEKELEEAEDLDEEENDSEYNGVLIGEPAPEPAEENDSFPEDSDDTEVDTDADAHSKEIVDFIESKNAPSTVPDESAPDPAPLDLIEVAESESEAETEEPSSAEETDESPETEEDEEPAPVAEAEVEVVEEEAEEEVEETAEEIDLESLSDLQRLVFELVGEYANEVEDVSVNAEFPDAIDLDVDEELLESVLSNLLEIGIYQWKEGKVVLRVSQKDDQVTFAVDSSGKPLSYGELDESQTNRIASALDRKIDVDMPSENELRMRYRYTPDEDA